MLGVAGLEQTGFVVGSTGKQAHSSFVQAQANNLCHIAVLGHWLGVLLGSQLHTFGNSGNGVGQSAIPVEN